MANGCFIGFGFNEFGLSGHDVLFVPGEPHIEHLPPPICIYLYQDLKRYDSRIP
jgi:hypothetical protein